MRTLLAAIGHIVPRGIVAIIDGYAEDTTFAAECHKMVMIMSMHFLDDGGPWHIKYRFGNYKAWTHRSLVRSVILNTHPWSFMQYLRLTCMLPQWQDINTFIIDPETADIRFSETQVIDCDIPQWLIELKAKKLKNAPHISFGSKP